jgi:hypothetical protein
MMWGVMATASLALMSCGESDPVDTTASPAPPLDVRPLFIPAPAFGRQYISPEVIVPAFSERQWCYFVDYDGEDVGVLRAAMQESRFGHHTILLLTNGDPEKYPNGAFIDCTTPDSVPMIDMETLIFPNSEGEEGSGESDMILPDGMAMKLKKGSRFVLQSHYINTAEQDILVQNAATLEFIQPDQVETWAASYVFTTDDITIPANQAATLTIRCAWEQDASVLMLNGHMHEHGASMSVDLEYPEGASERLYEVDTWHPDFANDSPTLFFEPGEFTVRAGDTFVTTCSWNNDTDHALSFPTEMCATSGFMYPSVVPLYCIPD